MSSTADAAAREGPAGVLDRALEVCVALAVAVPPFLFGGREATGRAMQEPYTQVTLELGDGVARRLRRDPLGERRLANAAELDRLGEGSDGAQFVEGHGAASINPRLLLVQPFMD